jgi:hypothetical protein
VRAGYVAGCAPVLVTAIIESEDEPLINTVDLRTAAGDGSGKGVAFTVRTAEWTEVVAFTRWAGQPNDVEPANRCIVAGIATDARVLCWREAAGHAGAAVLVDGTVFDRPGCIEANDQQSRTKEHERSCAG